MASVEDALALAERYLFGAEPGRIPAVVHEALEQAAGGRDRSRLAAALARCWAYAGEPDRAVRFADLAVAAAEAVGDEGVLGEALDAQLAAHWGVDETDLRRRLTRRLDEVTAHSTDADLRLRAHAWMLTVACESLDVAAMNRQVHTLEELGEESPRAAYVAASRRLMLDLVRGHTGSLEHLVARAERALAVAPQPDGTMVVGAMRGYGAVVAGDRATAAEMAALAERVADAQGIREVYAESAWLWLGSGDLEHARALAERFDAGVLAGLPRNFNYLLVLQLLLEVALATDARRIVEDVTPLLLPYEGRAVVNAGAVMFHGVTDDPLSRALEALGRPEESQRLRDRALTTYRRLGARWWAERLESSTTRPTVLTFSRAPGGWLVGSGAAPVLVPGRRGLTYLHTLVSNPGTEVSAETLVNGLEVATQRPLGPTSDRQAARAYRARLATLDAQLDDADRRGDASAGQELAAERSALVAELAAASGLGRRPRAVGGSEERARVAVRKAITAALESLRPVDAPLAEHLESQVTTGLRCCYAPDPAVAWRLAPQATTGSEHR